MLNKMARLIGLLILFLGSPVIADVLVLTHGYLGSGHSWRSSGVGIALQQQGWQDAGHAGLHYGRLYLNAPVVAGEKGVFYTVELPSEAPILLQSDLLATVVAGLKQRHPNEAVVLVGHSAGGVAARAMMIRYPHHNIKALITIASPHLGTDKAELGLSVADSPASWVAPFFGGQTINRSQRLYADLVRERPHTFLFWLNRRVHPEATYISFVREPAIANDNIVPAYSQHLEAVFALRNKARSIPTVGEHGLLYIDGQALAQVLNSL